MKQLFYFLILLLIAATHFDAQAQWRQSNFGMPNFPDTGTTVYAFTEIDTLMFASTSRGVFTSRDHGYNWRAQHWGANNYDGIGDVGQTNSKDIMSMVHRYTLDHPKWLWVHQANNFRYDRDSLSGVGIAIDPQGNAIVAANLWGIEYLDDTILQAPTGALVIFKFDTSGNLLWYKMSKTPHGNVNYTSVACDSQGNIYAAGLLGPSWDGTTPSVDFGAKLAPGVTSAAFIISYDSTGRFRWEDTPGGSTGSVVENVWVQADLSGNAYLAGTFSGDLYSGSLSTTLIRNPKEGDAEDLFLAKYNKGSTPWRIQTTSKRHFETNQNYGPNEVVCQGLSVDANGNCYVLGSSRDTEFVAGQMLTGQGEQFITKYNADGNGIWVVPFLGFGPYQDIEPFSSISCDREGNIAVCGTSETDQITFNNKTYNTNGMPNGWTSGLLAAFDSSGATRWFKISGIWGTAPQLCVSGIGNVFVNSPGVAQTFDSVSVIVKGNYSNGCAITKLRSDGTIEWAFSDGMSGILAAKRDQSLYALWAPAQLAISRGSTRFGRIGWMGSMALAKLSAEAPGETIDTDLWAYYSEMSVDKGRSWLQLSGGGSTFDTVGTTIITNGARSTDYGETWKTINGSFEYMHTLGNVVDGWSSNGNSGYSTDTGTTWQQNACRLGLGMEVSVGNRTFAEGGGMSDDTFKTWIATTVGIEGGTGRYGYMGDDYYSRAIGVAGNILLDGSGQLSASTSWGETWYPVGDGLPGQVVSIHQYGSEVLVGLKDAGVWRRNISEIPPLIPSTMPVFDWAQQIHSWADASGDAIAIDSSGNSVVFGSFEGSVTIGSQTLTHHTLGYRDRDYYLTKFDNKGSVIWTTQFQGGGIQDSTRPPSIAISPSGDIYIGANFLNSLTAGSFKIKGNPYQPQCCLIKCDANGQVQWVDSVATSQSDTWLGQITLDHNADVVVTGQAATHTSVDGILLPDNVNYQGSFIALFGSDGGVKWAKRILPTYSHSYPKGIAVSSDNNYYVGGAWRNGYFVLKGAGLFLEEYSPTGDLLDTVFAGKSDADSILSLSADGAGNIYALGAVGDSVTLGNTTLKRGFKGDPRFLTQFRNGHWNWAKTIGFQDYTYFRRTIVGPPCKMTTTADGSTYVIGLDSVFGQQSNERIQGINYATKYNSSGDREWTKQINNGYSCTPLAIAANGAGSVWTAGMILNVNEVPSYPNGCDDMAFGIIGMRQNKSDSNFVRPFAARLSGGSSIPLAVNNPVNNHETGGPFARIYPNPMSGIATVQFHTDKPETIRITLCDQLGREVKDIFSGQVQPGDFEHSVICTEIDDGNYYLRVESASGIIAVPVAIVR